jgi:uncharacterized membrane protein (DUF4010 family)
MDEPLWHRLGVALGIGLIVGLERGWKTRDQHGGRRIAGFRTFALAGLSGGVLAALSLPDRFVILAAGTLVVGALIVIGYVISAREQRDFGMTTELGMLATFGLGATAALGAPFEATAAAIVMTLLLGFKAEFHKAIEGLERRELLATLQLVAMAAVLVPLLPNRQMGPWDAVNPRIIGMLVLLIAGLSYVGYFAMRTLGTRIGLLLTALFGGLSSSTAVTIAYAKRARTANAPVALLAGGIGLACATMSPRLLVEAAAIDARVLRALWPTLAALTLAPLVAAAFTLRRARTEAPAEVRLSNPLQLSTALTFGALLTVLSIATAGIRLWLGDAGTYAVAAITGLVDVDAITLTLARNAASGGLEPLTAARGIVIAALVNTGVKAGIAAALGGSAMLRSATAILAAALAAGAVTALLTLS